MATWTQAFSTKSAYVLYLTVTETGTSTDNNTSTVAWSAKIVINDYLAFSDYAADLYVTLDGTDRLRQHISSYSCGDGRTVPYTKNIGSGTATIQHQTDGKKSLSCLAGVSVASGTYSPGSASISKTLALTDIPRASGVSAADGVTGSGIKIAVERASSAFTHTLEWNFAGHSGTIASGVGTECTWTPATETMAPYLTTADSGTCTITCKTYNGATLVGTKTCSITLSFPASISPTAGGTWHAEGYNNQGGAAGIHTWIQGYSKLGASIYSGQITTYYGASITEYGLTVENKTYSGASAIPLSDVLTGSGEITYTVYAKDSRGRMLTDTKTVTVNPYGAPVLVSTNAFRCTSAGVRDEDGTYISAVGTSSVSTLGGLNTGTLRLRYRQTGGTWGSYITLTSGTASVTGSGQILVSKTYEAEISLTDTVGNTAVSVLQIPTNAVSFHIRDGGKGAAFFGYATEDGKLRVHGDIAAEDGTFSGAVSGASGTFMGSVTAENLADTVTEQGTENGWTYRKWANGRLEQWAKLSVTYTWGSWGSLYEGTPTAATTFGVAFASAPTVYATCSTANWAIPLIQNIGTSSCMIYGVRPNAGGTGANTYYFSIYAAGTWE